MAPSEIDAAIFRFRIQLVQPAELFALELPVFGEGSEHAVELNALLLPE